MYTMCIWDLFIVAVMQRLLIQVTVNNRIYCTVHPQLSKTLIIRAVWLTVLLEYCKAGFYHRQLQMWKYFLRYFISLGDEFITLNYLQKLITHFILLLSNGEKCVDWTCNDSSYWQLRLQQARLMLGQVYQYPWMLIEAMAAKLIHVVFKSELLWVMNKLLNTTSTWCDVMRTMNSSSKSLQAVATSKIIEKLFFVKIMGFCFAGHIPWQWFLRYNYHIINTIAHHYIWTLLWWNWHKGVQ